MHDPQIAQLQQSQPPDRNVNIGQPGPDELRAKILLLEEEVGLPNYGCDSALTTVIFLDTFAPVCRWDFGTNQQRQTS